VRRDGRDAERAFHAVEDRLERLRGEVVEPVLGLPALEHVVGRAEAGTAVDERRAAEPAAQREHDRRSPDGRRLAGVAIQAREHVARPRGERAGGMLPALLEHDDRSPRLRELLRHHASARPGADHAHVRAELDAAGDGGAVHDGAGDRVLAAVGLPALAGIAAVGLPALAGFPAVGMPGLPSIEGSVSGRVMGSGGARGADLFHACRGVVAERGHHAGIAVVAHHRRRAERLGELRDRRDAAVLERAQGREPAGAVEPPEAPLPRCAWHHFQRVQGGAQRCPVSARRGGEPRLEGLRGVGVRDRWQRRLRCGRGVGEREHDVGTAAHRSRASCASASARIRSRARWDSPAAIAAATPA
jgi:hypothetical protein